jgi:hypothetical protein
VIRERVHILAMKKRTKIFNLYLHLIFFDLGMGGLNYYQDSIIPESYSEAIYIFNTVASESSWSLLLKSSLTYYISKLSPLL